MYTLSYCKGVIILLGTIIGDIAGSRFEFSEEPAEENEFEIFSDDSYITDETVMSIAVAEAMAENWGKSSAEIKKALIDNMQKYGRKFPKAGYGRMFSNWIDSERPKSYGSCGSGSAMRAISVGWLANNINDVNIYARLSAEVTHDHPEGIKGAQAAASAVFLARNGCGKNVIKKYLINEYGYAIDFTTDYIRNLSLKDKNHMSTDAIEYAMSAFMEGEDFESVIRKAVSLGGDTDTIASIAGAIAEAYYGVPKEMEKEIERYIPEELKAPLNRYRYIIMYRRNKRRNSYNQLFQDIEYFRERSGKKKKKLPIFMQNFDEIDEEIERLEKNSRLEEIENKGYVDTIEIHNLCMDFNVFMNNVEESGMYLLRAMLTSIVKQERFNRGVIDSAIEEGVIRKILDEMMKRDYAK